MKYEGKAKNSNLQTIVSNDRAIGWEVGTHETPTGATSRAAALDGADAGIA